MAVLQPGTAYCGTYNTFHARRVADSCPPSWRIVAVVEADQLDLAAVVPPCVLIMSKKSAMPCRSRHKAECRHNVGTGMADMISVSVAKSSYFFWAPTLRPTRRVTW